jgi:aryl-alcohol dehydrogenase-like predicted oxidoreductase
MEYRLLGRSGVHVSAVALGTMMFGRGGNTDVDECVAMIHRALDAGITLVDTADGYGLGDSEEIVGQALASGGRRDEVVLATKCYFPRGRDLNRRGGSRRWIVQACEDSLRRLRVDHLDLYQLHRLDPNTDLEESLGAMDDLVRAGKVRMVGHSGVAAEQLVECQWTATRAHLVRPVTEQPPYSIFARYSERALLPACLRYGVGAIVYGPLNGGWLSGKYTRDAAPAEDSRARRAFFSKQWWDFERAEIQRKFDVLDELRKIAGERGIELSHLALAFTLAHPAVSAAIIGPRTPAQLDDLLAGVDTRLSNDALDRIDELVTPGTDVDPANFVAVNPDLADPARRRRPPDSSTPG